MSIKHKESSKIFASRNINKEKVIKDLDFDIQFSNNTFPNIINRLTKDYFFSDKGIDAVLEILEQHKLSAYTVKSLPIEQTSAGKNTYTYDAHTYHTKVPPQGIAELLKHYLPSGGLVLDMFAGSGMTGVASIANGYDCILNELSPSACFIANRFISKLDPNKFTKAVDILIQELQELRQQLYGTVCRECGKLTEIRYTVWSYNVICNCCQHEFRLWDNCRKYGKRVKEHKILTEFPCPACKTLLKKSRLKRTISEPVLIGYICCGSRQKEVSYPPNKEDLDKIYALNNNSPLAEGFYPTLEIPDGVNLGQPKKHGLDKINLLYTPRNLAALSHIWKKIHQMEDKDIAAHLAFVFTSLYQRVTRLSEFRFWGGSGNTARFNVPYIFNETNVFLTFLRKAKTIHDHLATTTKFYSGKAIVVQNSATSLNYLPDESIDLIFTDPPFGANINYSEMNILWEAWLNKFTEPTEEVIINKFQKKDVVKYQELMTKSLKEAFRVLRTGHWMLLMFMNSSSKVWLAIKDAIIDAGFKIHGASIFDKEHGTFKHFVHGDTPGCDLVIYCQKPKREGILITTSNVIDYKNHIIKFLEGINVKNIKQIYLHVDRNEEIDYKRIYSQWMKQAIMENIYIPDFKDFCLIVQTWMLKE